MRLLWTIFFLSSILNLGKAHADNGRLYTSEELSSSAVTNICQDKYGYIWVGTECGLNKFDGYHFTPFISQVNDTTTIADSNISAIYVDREGHLWIGSGKGLSRYDYHSNSFRRYRFPGNIQPRVSSFAENSQGLLIGTAGYGMFSIRKGTDTIHHDTSRLFYTSEDFYSRIHIDAQGQLWRSSHEPILTRYKLDADNKVVSKQNYKLPCGPAVCFLQKDSKTMYIVCLYGIMEFDATTQRVSDAGFDLSAINEKVSIRNARFDSDGNLFLCTSGNGLMKIAKGTRTLTQAFANDNILLTSNANAILIDKDQNIWTSCYNKGIYKIDNARHPFVCWDLTTQNIQTGSGISSLATGPDNELWCTVQNNGLYVFDLKGNLKSHPQSPAGTGLVYCDRRGRFWLCTEQSLYSYDPKTGASEQRLRFDGWGLNCMADDKEGRLYISNFGKGLCVYDTNSGERQILSMNQHSQDKPYLWNDWISSLMIDSRGMLWIGTTKGLSRMNTSNGEISSFPGGCLLPDIRCSSLAEGTDGEIFIGTSSGLYRYSYKTNTAKPFSIEELQIQIDNLVDNIRRVRGKYSGKQEQADKVETLKVEGNDEVLMRRIMKSVNEHLSEPDFNVERLSEDIGLSRAQLHRKMKEITGISSSEFVRNIRLEQAAKLICEGKINITQVAYAVGYNNQTHFSTVFKKHFGMSPTDYAAKNGMNKTPN